ncbi:glycosyltransferase family 9 protein [Actinokineospora bangkokensis]|uniref:Glycosyl transferase n=1 Tax=Actinokineospora bangkokensis TaxID=1193682 RepID=A0A1Q9LLN3_9PSEU|nr:glycosyltransferase family 9 protein [Actinokineospora bangkokensis]OLR92942.1 glycosyl transferase [Actinokineospora bangkokensis]
MLAECALGPVAEPFPDIAHIAVLRGGGLGDLLFAMPAVHALARAYPGARITLMGTEMHRELLDRPSPVREVLPLPRVHGVHDPRGEGTDHEAARQYLRRVGQVDLAVQLHGGGRWSNPFINALRPRHSAGGRTPDAEPLERNLPFRYFQHEVMRWLEVAGLAGAPPVQLVPQLAITPGDLAAARRVIGEPELPVVVIHPGASDPRRRWPAGRFARVAAECAARACVLVVGDASEAALADDVVRLATAGGQADRIRSLAGRLSMSALVGVLARADVVLANDSGPRHLAEAVGTPTVSVYWMGNVINAGSPGRLRNRVHISWTSRCPVCGVDCTRPDVDRCPHDVSFVADVEVRDVLPDVLEFATG